jgi:hypothetical protein
MGQDFWSGLGVGRSWKGAENAVSTRARKPGLRSVGARVPARQLHIEHLGAFTALHRSEGIAERCLQDSAARGALELEGHLVGHRKAFRPARSGVLADSSQLDGRLHRSLRCRP